MHTKKHGLAVFFYAIKLLAFISPNYRNNVISITKIPISIPSTRFTTSLTING